MQILRLNRRRVTFHIIPLPLPHTTRHLEQLIVREMRHAAAQRDGVAGAAGSSNPRGLSAVGGLRICYQL